MAGLTPLPQTHTHSSQRVTHSQAHSLLSSFLTLSETNPAYRPDAVLTQSGPTSTGVGANSNLTLTHLTRILQGIAGKRVGGLDLNYSDIPGKKREAEVTSSPPVTGAQKRRREEIVELEDGEDGRAEAAIVTRETDDWQEKEDYEHAQVEETEHFDGRDPSGRTNVDIAEFEGPGDAVDAGSVKGQARSKAEKEARKLAKKERHKKRLTHKNEKRKAD